MKLFKELTEKEVKEFKAWAHKNYKLCSEINGVWHPVVQEECARINRKAKLVY